MGLPLPCINHKAGMKHTNKFTAAKLTEGSLKGWSYPSPFLSPKNKVAPPIAPAHPPLQPLQYLYLCGNSLVSDQLLHQTNKVTAATPTEDSLKGWELPGVRG